MKFSSLFYIVSLLVLTLSCASPMPKGAQESWKPLFNGKNLDGWDIKISGHVLNDNYQNTFRVRDGLMEVGYEGYDNFNNQFGHIFYNNAYSHYRLRVEYRFIGDQAPGGAGWALRNSGIMFHSQSAASMLKDQDFPISLEAQFLGGDGENERSTMNLCTPGTHVNISGAQVTDHCINSSSATFHGDQWVTAELEVYGDSLIRHYVNGVQVMEYDHPVYGGGVVNNFDTAIKQDGKPIKSGYISLQSESHPIQFRKVELLELK